MQLPGSIVLAVENGNTVIASSARAARALRRSWGQTQRSRGIQAWQSPDILDWDSWLNRLWQKRLRSGRETRLLLTAAQEHQVWVRLLGPHIEGRRLISVTGVAELAQQAYALLCTYRALDFLNGEKAVGYDVENFRTWARTFNRECAGEGWLSRSELPIVLADEIPASSPEPRCLVLTGFDRITPAQDCLIKTFQQQGCLVEFAGPSEVNPIEPPILVAASGKTDEIATCALWVRQRLSEAAARADSPRIAVIVPSVSGVRGEIERIFRRVLAPAAVTIGRRENSLPYEFSLGLCLRDVPMTRAALLLLRWMLEDLPQDQASWLMLSGFVCENDEELLPMAAFDARLRSSAMRPPTQNLDAFIAALGRNWKEAAPLARLQRRLQKARRLSREDQRLNFAQWTSVAEQVLEALSWPGTHKLISEDFQVQARWSQLLHSVAELTFDERRVDHREFLQALEHQAEQIIFAPESQGAQVQILGPFEAAGLTFDEVWFLGADDQNWPTAARSHPFLSRSVQRTHQMPHADTEVDWNLAQQATLRIQNSARRCVFSFALQDGDTAGRPSTVLNAAMQTVPAAQLRIRLGAEEDLAAEHDFPKIHVDEEPAAVLPWPAELDAGGADVLRTQAACPFRAFASRRLAARGMNQSDWGLNPGERGSVVHTILEKLWAELKDRDSLREAHRDNSLPSILARHTDDALARFRSDGPKGSWNQAYLEAERERILGLLTDWLAYEEKRSPFTVEAREDKRGAAIGDLKLQVRVDRIDAVTGGRVIIDYKTGALKKDIWEGPRPDDPQLPIYAGFAQVENLKGVLLGRVAEGKVGLVGRVEHADLIEPGENALAKFHYSEELLRGWQSVLTDLAQQFLQGEAQVDPKQYPATCKFCDLSGLCRIAESERACTEEEAGGNGETD